MDLVLVNGVRTDKNRTEAQARADRQKRYQGERFEQSERRWFAEARQRFDLAIGSAIAAMEDAHMTPADIQEFKSHVEDAVDCTWAVDSRAPQ